ncbi:MAG: mechanosensitive ion channel [Chitinophagaceae bacterium]|nr:mechanosensitive ion channel [Chitinophagaceae bacterium]
MEKQGFSVFKSVWKRLNKPALLFIILMAINFTLPLLGIKGKLYYALDKTTDILITISFALILIGFVNVGQDYILHVYDLSKGDNLRERKIRTQLQFVRKFLISFIIVLAVCAILLSFENVRKLGTGLLTGVGLGGIIIGFAAQKSLGNLLAGFQIAFTQPLRIDDVLVVEGEWGRVEEITLTYVVLNIWDQRRLILPINYFIEKPFQNWTRTTAELLGTVFIYLDYTAPIDAIRAELKNILAENHLWDKRVSNVQVTDTTANGIQIRILVSAATSGQAFDLRCIVRERLISFIQKNHPGCLPKTRAEIASD